VPPDYSSWPTRQQAADRIGVSTKWIEQMAGDGRLESALYKRPSGGNRVRVYNPGDVDRIAAARRQEAGGFVLAEDAGITSELTSELTPAADLDGAQALTQLLVTLQAIARLLELASSGKLLGTPSPPALFVDLEQAAVITGLPVPALRRRLQLHGVEVVRSDRLYVRRRDLEAL
jgi:hypothetical protein